MADASSYLKSKVPMQKRKCYMIANVTSLHKGPNDTEMFNLNDQLYSGDHKIKRYLNHRV